MKQDRVRFVEKSSTAFSCDVVESDAVKIYFNNYEFILSSRKLAITSKFDTSGYVRDIINGPFDIFVNDENGKDHVINSDEPNFAGGIVDLFRAV
jgi:hypothetical protein